MSSTPRHNSKYLHPNRTSYHSVSDHEGQSECSPRGSISLATSDDNLLPSYTPVSTAPHSEKAVHYPRRSAPRTVKFAEKAHLSTSSPAPIYPPLNKSQKAKHLAKATLRGAGTVAGGILGCICFIAAKACILDGGSGLSGSGSRVVVARPGEDGFVQGNRRVVDRDMRGYIGYENQKRGISGNRAGVPPRVRVAHHQQTHGGTQNRTVVTSRR